MTEKSDVAAEVAILQQQKDQLMAEMEAYKSDIHQITEGKPLLKDIIDKRLGLIAETVQTLSENVDKINTYHKELLLPKEGENKPLFEQVGEAFENIYNYKEASYELKQIIENYKVELLGDPEKAIEGQKHIFDNLEEEIKSKKKLWEENTAALIEKIEGLLPGATATGLAKAYQAQRKSYSNPYLMWSSVFVITMCCIMYFAIINLKEVQSLEEACNAVISRLPFFVPAFWLAIFASKQQSQNKRLQQEYAYKEALAKSYEADKREIEKLPDGDDKNRLSAKLLETMIDSAKFNPSETLVSKSHNDSPPSVLDIFKLKVLSKFTGVKPD